MNTLRKEIPRPNVYIIAGPNGSGKTTFARKFLPQYVRCLEFVNADLIAGGLSPFAPEKAAIHAGRLMLEEVHTLANRGKDFGFETTLSGKAYVRFLDDLKNRGYRIHLFFLWISSIQLALQRIKTRVRNGGHDVPEGIDLRRFGRSPGNFFNYYQPLAESWTIFDNSGETPKMIAFEESGKREVLDPLLFNLLLKHRKKQ